MLCPHCQVAFNDNFSTTRFDYPPVVLDGRGLAAQVFWYVHHIRCPTCYGIVFQLQEQKVGQIVGGRMTVYPASPARPVPKEVEEPYRTDFLEACAVLKDSAKASAAISRRCLQMILRDAAKVKPGDLSREIDEVLPKLPSMLAESVDAIRNIGNFAAHPMKSTNTGEVIPVETGEAEWLLDVLEGLFDFYFVQPAILKKKRDELNKKLADVKKPPMK